MASCQPTCKLPTTATVASINETARPPKPGSLDWSPAQQQAITAWWHGHQRRRRHHQLGPAQDTVGILLGSKTSSSAWPLQRHTHLPRVSQVKAFPLA
ncbi:hypothetical protein JG688_00010559 [Phytophthora aleatoria]|uniref:Uncharacterized protein n=1 Tax=Phytophthora aleatoria TaxID=2496075 RepID=A0A8J5IE84_9STRA|nr:hypothetical protein JG688_00010559 [Phytophthora aleatoria]